jgi:hypothetical protein
VAIFAVRRKDVRFEQRTDFSLNTTLLCFRIPRSTLISLRAIFSVSTTEKRLKERRHENIEAQAAATMELTGISERGIHQLLSGLAETLATVY